MDGNPAQVSIATTEKVPLNFDFNINMLPGESVANPTAILTDTSTATVAVLATAPSVLDQHRIQQLIVGSSDLVATHTFRIAVTADIVGLSTNKRTTISTNITVPY